jgi:hypothetical protein
VQEHIEGIRGNDLAAIDKADPWQHHSRQAIGSKLTKLVILASVISTARQILAKRFAMFAGSERASFANMAADVTSYSTSRAP